MVKRKKFIYKAHFDGMPKQTDLELVEEELPPLQDGEYLVEAIYLSVDASMRLRANDLHLGQTFIGSQLAKVIQSKNRKYPVGKFLVGDFGWSTHTIGDDRSFEPWPITDLEGLPFSLFLGVLGMPGNAAYFGLYEILQPKFGETLAVTCAGGAVGSTVGQLAKLEGCTVIAITGTTEKVSWLARDLNFDSVLNYKDQKFDEQLEQAAPFGIDMYFDNVGGPISSKVLNVMNGFGRVAICGAISGYNDRREARAEAVQFPIVFRQLKMEGFVVNRWEDRWFEGIQHIKKLIMAGRLHYWETVTEGFENMFKAFVDMLEGRNIGKAVVKV